MATNNQTNGIYDEVDKFRHNSKISCLVWAAILLFVIGAIAYWLVKR